MTKTDIRKSIIGINAAKESIGYEFAGTGFLVEGNLILTCAHVLANAYTLDGKNFHFQFERDSRPQTAELVASNEFLDIAILRPAINRADIPPLQLAYSETSGGNRFTAFGYPQKKGIKGLHGVGDVIGHTDDDQKRDVLQLSSEQITYGFSGGPVRDETLKAVIGVISSGVASSPAEKLRDVVFAIPTETLKKIYPDLKVIEVQPKLRSGLSATPPAPPAYFVGRQRLRKKIKAELLREKATNILFLIGMGGIGKTSLALQVASETKDCFSEVFWGDFSSVNGDAKSILREWGKSCGEILPATATGEEMVAQVRSLLRLRRNEIGPTLIMIDDLREEWVDAGRLLLKSVPENIPVLITSREETVAQKLGNKTEFLDTYPLTDPEAYKMLKAYSGNEIKNDNAKFVARVCENMPLALELAAKVAKFEGTSYLLKKLTEQENRLTGFELNNPKRKEESVKITFDISYNTLPPTTALIFRCLGAFAPVAITPQHLKIVLANSGISDVNADEELRCLRRYSLLQNSNDLPSNDFYRMHTLLHEYATKKLLIMEQEASQARLNHFVCFQKIASEYRAVNLAENEYIKSKEFKVFYPQFMQALQNYSLLNAKDKDAQALPAIQMIQSMNIYWDLYRHFDDQKKWLKIAYECAQKINSQIHQADFARRIGRVLTHKNELDEALDWMNICENHLLSMDADKAVPIRALMYIHKTVILVHKGDFDSAKENILLGIKLTDKSSAPQIYAEGYNILGVVEIETGDLLPALGALKESLAVWEQVDNRYQIYRVKDNVRSCLYYLGEIADLREAEDKSVQDWKQFPNNIGLAMALTNRGLVHYIDEEHETAIRIHQQAMDLSDRLMDQRMRALTRLNIAWPYMATGEYDKAEKHLQNSLEIQADYEAEEFKVDAIRCLAEVEIGRRHYDKAIEIAKEAVAFARDEDDPLEIGAALRVLGQAYYQGGNLNLARTCLEESLAIFQEKGYKYETYLTLKVFARLSQDLGEMEKARAMEQEVHRLSQEMGLRDLR